MRCPRAVELAAVLREEVARASQREHGTRGVFNHHNGSVRDVTALKRFQPLSDDRFDLLLQGEELIALRPVTASTGNTYILQAMAKALETIIGAKPASRHCREPQRRHSAWG